MPDRRKFIRADEFQGGDYPPETIVRFESYGKTEYGIVWRQLFNKAVVVNEHKMISRVLYHRLQAMDKLPHLPYISLPEIESFAIGRMDKYKELYMKHWQFGFDNAESRSGRCNYNYRLITLTLTYCAMMGKEEIIDTVLHEIAHALTPGKGHGAEWQRIAKRIGCKASQTRECGAAIVGTKWFGECGCGNTWRRSKLSKHGFIAICAACKNHIVWEDRIQRLAGVVSDYIEQICPDNTSLLYTFQKIEEAGAYFRDVPNITKKRALELAGLKANPYNYTKLSKVLDAARD